MPPSRSASDVHAHVLVRVDARKGTHAVAARAIQNGEVITRITGHRVVAAADRFTVQVGAQTHIDDLGPLTYLNHSCAPNAILDTTELTLTAIRDIAAEEDLTFFYPSTEWQMAEPFACHCGTPSCVGVVAGAASLSDETMARYFINPHILELRRTR